MTTETRPEHRIAKLLARAGVASRREIERMIAEGRVALDGQVLDTPATLLRSLRGVTVDGDPVEAAAPARLFVYHKPPGLLVTERDPAGRPTIYDRLPADLPRVVPVGRLDLATEGLLLLTTDGGLKRTLELPATGVERAYRARAYGDITQAQLEELIEGVEIDGVRYGPIDANLERRTGANVWIELILTEGKNREVRRVLEHLGLQVSRLIRTRYGPFVLGDLPAGGVGEVRQHDLVAFAKSLKDGRSSEVRVEAVAPRTATRSTREPDAPRRATPSPRTRVAQAPRPVAVPVRGATAEARVERPGFRTPRSSDANATRAARFAARHERSDDDAPRAGQGTGGRSGHTGRGTGQANEARSGRTGPHAARPARARPDDARQGDADGWTDRPSPPDRPERPARPSRGDAADRSRSPRGAGAASHAGSPAARSLGGTGQASEARPGRTGPRAARPARAARDDARQGSAGGWPDRPSPGDRPRTPARPPRSDAPDRDRPPRGERPSKPRPGKPGAPRRPDGGGPARPPRGKR